jgi:hypothetical protein
MKDGFVVKFMWMVMGRAVKESSKAKNCHGCFKAE